MYRLRLMKNAIRIALAVALLAAAANAADTADQSAVRAAVKHYRESLVAKNYAALDRIWTDDYTFINPLGVLVTRAERLANFASGNTDVNVIDSEREITVRVYGDMAVVQNLSTLHGTFSGHPTDTDLRGTFVWVRRGGRWQLVTNELTPVVRPST